MQQKKRVFALALAGTLLCVLLSSALFIAHEAHHDCTGADCPICRQIEACIQTLKTIFAGAAAAAISASTLLILLSCAPVAASAASSPATLVSLKVKLSD